MDCSCVCVCILIKRCQSDERVNFAGSTYVPIHLTKLDILHVLFYTL